MDQCIASFPDALAFKEKKNVEVWLVIMVSFEDGDKRGEQQDLALCGAEVASRQLVISIDQSRPGERESQMYNVLRWLLIFFS